MQFVTLAGIIIMKDSIMLKIKIKVNDVIQAPKNKNTLMHVSSFISKRFHFKISRAFVVEEYLALSRMILAALFC